MTIKDWTKAKYPDVSERLLKALSGIETANPDLPAYVMLEERPEPRHARVRRMRRTAFNRAERGLDR